MKFVIKHKRLMAFYNTEKSSCDFYEIGDPSHVVKNYHTIGYRIEFRISPFLIKL